MAFKNRGFQTFAYKAQDAGVKGASKPTLTGDGKSVTSAGKKNPRIAKMTNAERKKEMTDRGKAGSTFGAGVNKGSAGSSIAQQTMQDRFKKQAPTATITHAPGQDITPEPQDPRDKFYEDMINQHKSGEAKMDEMADRQGAAFNRRANEVAARMGGSGGLGGSYAAASTAGLVQGMQNRDALKMQYESKLTDLMRQRYQNQAQMESQQQQNEFAAEQAELQRQHAEEMQQKGIDAEDANAIAQEWRDTMANVATQPSRKAYRLALRALMKASGDTITEKEFQRAMAAYDAHWTEKERSNYEYTESENKPNYNVPL